MIPCGNRNGWCPTSPTIVPSSSLTFLQPSCGPSSGGNQIIINGVNLIYTSSVMMGTTPVPFTILSNTQVSITAIPQILTPSILIKVRFVNSQIDSLPYLYVVTPNIISLTPSAGPISGGNILTINGSGLSATQTVHFGTITTYTFTVISDSTLSVVVPPLLGSVEVNVTTNGGTSNSLLYTVLLPPVI